MMRRKLILIALFVLVCTTFGSPIISSNQNQNGDHGVLQHNRERDQHQMEFLAKERSEKERVELDMIIAKPKPFFHHRGKRATLVDERYMWPNNTVPYVFDTVNPVNEELRNLTIAAVHHIEKYSCIRFKELTDEGYYVNITNSGPGCYSYLGFINYGPAEYGQTLNLADDCNGMEVTIHEFLHALGYYHEHSRPDRSDYITLNMSNILPGMETQFTKVNLTHGDEAGPVTLQNISYDIMSIMHYGQYAFTKHQQLTYGRQDQMTMYSNDDYMAQLGGYSLSEKDIIRLNTKYNCNVNITELVLMKKAEDGGNGGAEGGATETTTTAMPEASQPPTQTSTSAAVSSESLSGTTITTETISENNISTNDHWTSTTEAPQSTSTSSNEGIETNTTIATEPEDTTTTTMAPTTTTFNTSSLNFTLPANTSAEDFFGTNTSNWGSDANHYKSSMLHTLFSMSFIAICTFALF
ncbi:nematocyst expressed protein 6-like [Clytia hemisphaerica]